MSFRALARVVRDPAWPYGRRFIAFRQAVASYTWLRRASFTALYAELAARHGFDDEGGPRDGRRRPTAEQMIAALAEVERARDGFLARLATFAEERRVEKRLGRRVGRSAP